uniref:Uncharacterized protein n=1 Tax=Opuntia streptacantha TaxID=393608 RepID=A0A7C8ZEL7_OPUST
MKLTWGKIFRWGQNRVLWPRSIFNHKCSLQSPSSMKLQMTVHKPHPWVVSPEPNSSPSTSRDSDCIPLRRVHQVILGRVLSRVKVTNTGSNHKEVVPMKVERVRLHCQ